VDNDNRSRPAERLLADETLRSIALNKNRVSSRACIAALAVTATLLGAGCLGPNAGSSDSTQAAPAKTLVIRWQRLVDTGGGTCERCAGTEQAIDEANRSLTASLKPLGIRVCVVKTKLTAEQFKLDPAQSNRIWIADQPLETILGAKAGMSRCSGCCGDNVCRTTVVDRRTYETIPPELIVRAGLKAAADLIQPSPESGTEQFWPLMWDPSATE
jgi:hypothetical protein